MKWPPKPPKASKPRAVPSEPPGGPDPDALSSEERLLWRHVARSIEPIKRKPRVRRTGTSGTSEPDADDVPAPHRRPARTDAIAGERAKSLPHKLPHKLPSQKTATGATPPLADFDPRKAKKLGTGRTAIDARLDLHGLRQDEALGRLRRFLHDCHARGLKTVLVITGKGRETDDPTTPFVDTLDRHPRGVLRRNVPRWLDEPELRAVVVSFTTAAPRHGGDGAFYVQLRRSAREA